MKQKNCGENDAAPRRHRAGTRCQKRRRRPSRKFTHSPTPHHAGLTQQRLAELIGVTYQQTHNYETAVNRISAGRLYQMAQALGVEINYFFSEAGQGNDARTDMRELKPQQRLLLNWCAISS